MIATKSRLPDCFCLLALCCGLALALASCGSSNPNEAEFLNSAPPGKPPENPNETVSQRRSRTLRSPEKTKAEKAELSKSGAGKSKTP
jgi:hypothetical protein